MPLKKGASPKTISGNIKNLMHEYEKHATIGTSEPVNTKKAQKQAVAIALNIADDAREKSTKSKAKAKDRTAAAAKQNG